MTILDRVDILISEWKAAQPISADAQKLLDKKFRLEFNYNSNHLEGNTLTYGETELLLLFDDTQGGHTMREYEEMKAHDVAWQMVDDWANDKERPLTEQAIKNLNEIILVRPFWKDAVTRNGQITNRQIQIGDYKQHPNSVILANGEVFEYASPIDTPILMQELIEWYCSEDLHIVTMAAMLHYKFVRIHPFDDGNGRIARLLMNYVFLKDELPPIIIKAADKQLYLRALHIADTGDFGSFIDYVAEQLEWSLQISIKAARGESIEEEDDTKKEISLFKKSLNRKNESNKVRSGEEVKWILHHSGAALFIRLKETLAQFDELFYQAEVRFIFSEKEDLVYDIKSRSGGLMLAINSRFPESFLEWISKVEHSNIVKFGMDFYWSGYKRSTTAFSIGTYLLFTFDKFSYNLSRLTSFDNPDQYMEKGYKQQLSKEDIAFTVTQIANDLMEEIKQNHFDEE